MRRIRQLGMLLLTTFVVGCGPGVVTASGSDEESDGARRCRSLCERDDACGFHHLCIDGVCQFAACGDEVACLEGQVCTDDASVGHPLCLDACEDASTCGSGIPPYVASNYACVAGACRFEGCAADDECADGQVCAAQDEGVDVCRVACSQPADCTLDAGLNLAAWDADNHDCVDGVCVWLGCHSTDECDPGYACQ